MQAKTLKTRILITENRCHNHEQGHFRHHLCVLLEGFVLMYCTSVIIQMLLSCEKTMTNDYGMFFSSRGLDFDLSLNSVLWCFTQNH